MTNAPAILTFLGLLVMLCGLLSIVGALENDDSDNTAYLIIAAVVIVALGGLIAGFAASL